MPLPENRDSFWLKEFAERLKNDGLVDGYYNTGLELLPDLKRLSDSLEMPPTPDHWEATVKWFRSKWWSVPVILLAFVVTFIAGQIANVKSLLECIGIRFLD